MLPARLLLAVLGGMALLLSFPGYDVWPLALVGCGALALATAGARVWTGAASGFLLGLVWFGPMFIWAGTYAGPGPWIAMSALSALYPAALGALLAFLQRGGAVRPFVGAAAWVLMEHARAVTPFGGFPWGRLPYSQADSPLLGVATLAGVAGLGFLVALVGGLAARALQLLAERRRLRALGLVTAAAVLTFAPLLVPRPTDGPTVDVAGVQADVPEGYTRTLQYQPGEMLARNLQATSVLAQEIAAGERPPPDLVLWPEGASDLDPEHADTGEQVRSRLTAAAGEVGAPLLAGATSYNPEGMPQNMMYVVQPEAGVVDSYQKVYLAPFGEFQPLRPITRHLSSWVDRMGDYEAGTEVGTVDVDLRDGRTVPLGLAICFEVVMDRAMYDLVDEGAELLVVPTVNTWFGEGDQSEQHRAISRVRAVELGRSVAHVSNVGVSGLITPDGQVHEGTELFTADLLQAELPLRTEVTPAVRVAPLVPAAAAVVVLGALLLDLLTRRRAR